MAHEIETHEDQAAFVSAREDAWHRLGTVLPDVFTAEQALEVAHLANWNVRKTAASTKASGRTMRIPGCYATVRDNPFTGEPEVLGYVGEVWQPFQNEDHCELLNALVDESGAHFETAGSLRGGRNVFVTMKLPDTMVVAGTDHLDLYIAGLNAHDGTSSFRLIVTPVRIVCANTQKFALRNATSSISLRHTAEIHSKVAQAREALGLTFTYLEEFQQAAERMIDATLTEAKYVNVVNKVWPVEDSKRGQTIARERTDELVRLFSDADTQANIRGTRWAGLQAITEYLDHFSPVRNDDGDADDRRAERVLVGAQSQRQKAFDLLSR